MQQVSGVSSTYAVWTEGSGRVEIRIYERQTEGHFGLGRLYIRIGEREQARECLSSASRMYRSMDMHFHFSEPEMHLLG
jgi:hypothetical protein